MNSPKRLLIAIPSRAAVVSFESLASRKMAESRLSVVSCALGKSMRWCKKIIKNLKRLVSFEGG